MPPPRLNPLPPPLQHLIETQRARDDRRSHAIDEQHREEARDTVKRDADAKRIGVESDVPQDELMGACRLLATAPPIEWGAAAAQERLRQQWATRTPPVWSEADKARLDAIRAREAAFAARDQRRQALKPAALFARLKARAARVSWDSWG